MREKEINTYWYQATTKKVIEFLKHYIAQFGVPKKIRTDPGTVFVSEEFAGFVDILE